MKKSHTYPDGTTYEGEWIDGKRHGYGKWARPDGTVYTGKWENDKLAKFSPSSLIQYVPDIKKMPQAIRAFERKCDSYIQFL